MTATKDKPSIEEITDLDEDEPTITSVPITSIKGAQEDIFLSDASGKVQGKNKSFKNNSLGLFH